MSTPAKTDVILAACAKHPWWFTAPADDYERMVSAATMLNDPFNLTWEVWQGGRFVGLLMLWQVQARVDALLHFIFFDENLIGKRRLILGFLDHCFHDPSLGFQRISIQIPEFKKALLGFVRRKLGFTFEGETVVKRMVQTYNLKVRDPHRANHKESVDVLIASAGSRREAAHWHDGRWYDVLCLRQTAAEYTRFMERT